MATEKPYKVVKYNTQRGERWRVVDADSEKVLDDAQGYGYRTAQKAHAGWAYISRDKSKDDEKRRRQKEIRKWLKEHKEVVNLFEAEAFDTAVGRNGPEAKIDVALLKYVLKVCGVEATEFKPNEILRELMR